MTKLLSVKQASEQLGISLSKVYDLCAQRRIPHYKIEGAIRISEEQLQDYLEVCRVEPGNPAPRRKIKLN